MNGYKILADSYVEYLGKIPVSEETRLHLEQKIRVLNVIADISQDDIGALFDTGAFNDICEEYFRKAMKNSNMRKNKIEEVMGEFRWLLDTTSANEIVE